jgi:Tol biopolymer transport system component
MLSTLGENNQYASLAISRDGSRVVTDTTQGESSIRILDARGTRTLMMAGDGSSGFPVFSADGREVYFTSSKNGSYDILVKAVDGSSEERQVIKFEKGQLGALFLATSPDGKYLLIRHRTPSRRNTISMFSRSLGTVRHDPFCTLPQITALPHFRRMGSGWHMSQCRAAEGRFT